MAIKDYSLKSNSSIDARGSGPGPDLGALIIDLEDGDLIKLRQAIDNKLQIDPSMLNLADELGLQYRIGMTLLASVQDDKDVPANQRSQVFNSVGAMLEKIVKQQKVVYDAERLKRYEAAILKTLKSLPAAQQKIFFDLYGEYLKNPDKTLELPA